MSVTSRSFCAMLTMAVGSSLCIAGTWTKLVRSAPGGVNLMLQLSDGTVMCADGGGNRWFRLTPDIHGSYVNGTWSNRASSADTRLYFSSQVLRDGRVFVAGGEYGTGGARSEIYDPVSNSWSANPVPTTVLDPSATSPVTGGAQAFSDSNSEILPNGSVLIFPVSPKTSGRPVIYNPTTNAWTTGPLMLHGSYQDESSWVKLPTDMILTIDPFGVRSERYNPATNTWLNDSNVPVSLYDPFGSELGAALLLPNGKAFFLGSTGHTAIYTPSGTTASGVWVAGPDIPGARGTPDAPAAMMVNGKILCAVSPVPTSANHFPSPTTFVEYDYITNAFTDVSGPTGPQDSISCYAAAMLDLPDGRVLYSHFGTDLYVYTPDGAPLEAGKPVISSISRNLDGTFHLSGTGLNGISEGAAYGDDLQMASNYPLVRIAHSNGNTYYARTFNWSSTGVMTGATIVTAEYALPANLPAGSYSLVAVANGIASDAAVGASVISAPVSALGCPGGSVSLTVAAAGTPNLSYQWRRGAADLSEGGHFSGVNTPTLLVSSMTSADAGNDYNCVVTNAIGASASTMIRIGFCAADFSCDGTVDDADFVAFASAYDLLACTDPAMPVDCPADLSGDGIVDDADFVLFASAYDTFVCN
ncbi:MAG: hypothetical protein KF805_13425 [Phycisphaeraceae bacterium]|nr:hypothetical protein [Phycisphaeraceae bacterium]